MGQFYTSDEVSNFMVKLTTKSKSSEVLESDFGKGIFINSLLKAGFSNIKGYDVDEKTTKSLKRNLVIK